jgi:2-polyprenyl-3-methyl-5-hydroxy-6-metoxy-1,4-benzoquinol methylase
MRQGKLIEEWWQEEGSGDQSMEDGHDEFWDDFISNGIDVDFTGKKILDFGCNQGGMLRRIYERMKFREAIGVDLAKKSIAHGNAHKRDLPIEYLALESLDSLDQDFDYATSAAVIYLISDIYAHAKQIFDRLKPGGVYFAWHPDYITDPRFKMVLDAVNEYAAVKCAQNTLDDIIRGFQAGGFSVYVKRLIPTGYISVPHNAISRWYGTATNEIAYRYEHRYSFRCVKPVDYGIN